MDDSQAGLLAPALPPWPPLPRRAGRAAPLWATPTWWFFPLPVTAFLLLPTSKVQEHFGAQIMLNPQTLLMLNRIFFFFSFRAIPMAYGSSQARDWIWATAMTYTAAAANSDPLTHCLRWNLLLHSNPSCCNQVLNPLCHSRNSWILIFIFKYLPI